MIAADVPPYNHVPIIEESRLIPAAAVNKLSPIRPAFEAAQVNEAVGFGLPHRHFSIADGEAVVWGVTNTTLRSRVVDFDPHLHAPFIMKVSSSGRVIPLEFFDISSIQEDARAADIIANAGLRLGPAAAGLLATGEHNTFTLTLMPAAIEHFLQRAYGISLSDTLAHEESDELTRSSWLSFSKNRMPGSIDSLWMFRPNNKIALSGDCKPTCNSCGG